MKSGLISICVISLIFSISCSEKTKSHFTVPFTLDHNRMLVDAKFKKPDGTWRKALLWVDTGAPNFFMSKSLAIDLGLADSTSEGNFEISPPSGIKIGGMNINFDSVESSVMTQPYWLFETMKIDGNLPAAVLQKYHVIFDYLNKRLTIAEPGSIQTRGERVPISLNPETGIIQVNVAIEDENFSFAIDIGASYSFTSKNILQKYIEQNPDIQQMTGSAGCANMWGWWPSNETGWRIVRLSEITFGNIKVENAAIVGLPDKVVGPYDIGTWYSQKTAEPVAGFLGPNVFKQFRLEIDYANSAIYLEKNPEFATNDLDIVGISLRLEPDGNYRIVGIVNKDGQPVIKNVEPGDILLQIDDFIVQGQTMGKVVDTLRGNPGDTRTLVLKRNGEQLKVETEVMRLL
ncbi:hypothetical protein ACFLTH_15140 [Bacteroidota bacterium]